MSPSTLILAVISIVLAASAQTLLKMGVSTTHMNAVMRGSVNLDMFWALGTSPLIIGGIGCFGLSILIWLSVLARVQLSVAYPSVALGVILTVLSGYFFLGESLSTKQVLGVAMIVGGVALVAFGGKLA